MVLNILDITFLILTFLIFLISLLDYFRSYNTGFLYKFVYYGNLAYKGPRLSYFRYNEMSKSYFRHFYVLSFILNSTALLYMVLVYFFNYNVNEYVRNGLKALLLDGEPVSVTAALTTMVLFVIHPWRRLYETSYVHVFAQSSKMYLWHYLLAIFHYTTCSISIIGAAPLFCGNQTRQNIPWCDINTSICIIPSTLLFIWGSYEQHQAHIILANLRKNKAGNVMTDDYRIPCGGLFKYVSNPHRMSEIVIYFALALLMQTRTYTLIFLWVATNQTQLSYATHQWYKKTFKNYPPERYAIFPYLL